MAFYTDHQPKISVIRDPENTDRFIKLYTKTETNDDFFFIKTSSISITSEVLEAVDLVYVILPHRNVALSLYKSEIKANSSVYTFKGETKFYCPVEIWKVKAGDTNWARKIKEDFKKKLGARA